MTVKIVNIYEQCLFYINQLSTLICSTNHVDICSLLDQTGDKVFMQDSSGHMQRCHPTAVDSINISTIADQDMYSRQSPVVHRKVQSCVTTPSFHLVKKFQDAHLRKARDGQFYCMECTKVGQMTVF